MLNQFPTWPRPSPCRCRRRRKRGCPARDCRRVPRRSEEAQCTREAVDFKPVGVTDSVIASIDVAKAPFNINDRLFRMRKLVIEPGGIVPWHSHADRPAIIYIIDGEIDEYASNCAVTIVHKAGDVVAETPEVSHWWKNRGDKTVVLLSADLLKDKNDHNM